MRFFTLAWWHGDVTGGEEEAVYPAFKRHLDSIRDRLPAQLLDLFEAHSLHDGRLTELTVDAEAKTAVMVVDGWNSFNGDYQVVYRMNFGAVKTFQLLADQA